MLGDSVIVPYLSLVVLLGLSAVFAANTGHPPLVFKTYEPESLYNHFKQNSDAQMAGASGVAYLTPKSKQLVNNGTISMATIEGDVNRLDNEKRITFRNMQKKIARCWQTLRDEGNGLLNHDLLCFLMSKVENSLDQLSDTLYHMIMSALGYQGTCPEGFEERVMEGISNVNFLKCLTQRDEEMGKVMIQLGPSPDNGGGGWGIHVELGHGSSLGYYLQESTGIAWSFEKTGDISVTNTICHGMKLDVSSGVGLSVSFLPDMNDLLGAALTLEVGIDVVGETGFDVLLHYAYGDDGFPNKFIGFGFAFGIGVGVIPVDVAVSYCNTELLLHFAPGHAFRYSLINVGGGGAFTSLECTEGFLGVSLFNKVCCPETVHPCTNEFCWLDGTKCPHSPADLADSMLVATGGIGTRYTVEYIILRTACPGLQILQPDLKTLSECTADFDSKSEEAGGDLVYMVFREDLHECWFSNSYSVETCFWTPSKVEKSVFKLSIKGGTPFVPHKQPYPLLPHLRGSHTAGK